ncbi:hypothetical protein ACIPC2_15010 [Curtobacterium pusillum]|uniref:hypothetical protein n=1 Tax=Curtobacterium pusillum TaxID=69373 RepID=UPI0038011D10
MSGFGPFSVEPQQIAQLGGANFGPFVAHLLAAEGAALGLDGAALETTYLENVGDGGVDAGLRSTQESQWVPRGESAWQFKAGDLSPAACKKELSGATRALEVLSRGGSYRLVLGASLTSKKVKARRDALVDAAVSAHISIGEGQIEVLAGDALARWAEQYPSIAVSPILGGIGHVGQGFDQWSQSIRHSTVWVSSTERDAEIADVRKLVESGPQVDLHVDGASGLGKTRLVLEAMRGEAYESLVVYVGASDAFFASTIAHLQVQHRAAILVVDECERRQHEVYAQALTQGTRLRLITIGQPDSRSIRTAMIRPKPLPDESMRNLLTANRPNLPPEASRVVVRIAAGNVDYALKLASAAIDNHAGSAGQLVQEEDIRAFFAERLPSGDLFLASAALALFTRFGFDGEVSLELDQIANGLAIPVATLRTASAMLDDAGLLTTQGRYRSVGPSPVAIHLAAVGWNNFGDRIVDQLIPGLEDDLLDRLLQRAVEIGEPDTASPAVSALLGEGGPLESLVSLGRPRSGQLLGHLAVLAPVAVLGRLAKIFDGASDADLLDATSARRDLVWALSKISWHSEHFRDAAELLLRLAIAENERYSNNASGTWVELFGTMLPGTAASPGARAAYLDQVAASGEIGRKLLVVRAASRALDGHESIMASGELQGGLVVERRGAPRTYDEMWAYHRKVYSILGSLARDRDSGLAAAARKAIVNSLHGSLMNYHDRDALVELMHDADDALISDVRVEVESLRSLFSRVDLEDGDTRVSNLDVFAKSLPAESAGDRIKVLVHTDAWDRPVSEVADRIANAAREVDSVAPSAVLLDLIEPSVRLPSAYALGVAIATLGGRSEETLRELGTLLDSASEQVLFGFLQTRASSGESNIFDEFIDSGEFSPDKALELTVRGPESLRSRARVEELLKEVAPARAARFMLPLIRDEATQAVEALMSLWNEMCASQDDYNAMLEFVSLVSRSEFQLEDSMALAVWSILLRRDEYPEVGQQSWGWSRTARLFVGSRANEVALLVAALISKGVISGFSGSEEAALLRQAVGEADPVVWEHLMDQLADGDWRLSLSVQEWLGDAVSVATAENWVSGELERARVLAGVVKPEGDMLSPAVVYLLSSFGHDEKIRGRLIGGFISGSWTGNESALIDGQLETVARWRAAAAHPAVVTWLNELVEYLRRRRKAALQEEAERGW